MRIKNFLNFIDTLYTYIIYIHYCTLARLYSPKTAASTVYTATFFSNLSSPSTLPPITPMACLPPTYQSACVQVRYHLIITCCAPGDDVCEDSSVEPSGARVSTTHTHAHLHLHSLFRKIPDDIFPNREHTMCYRSNIIQPNIFGVLNRFSIKISIYIYFVINIHQENILFKLLFLCGCSTLYSTKLERNGETSWS